MKGFGTLDKWRYAQWPEGLLLNGDCEEVLKDVPDESVDMIFTDPPYSLRFMQLSWDEALPSVSTWKECFRVLKPGGWAFIMCIPRQDCQSRMIINLEDAGFNVSFTPIFWAFAQGFPKAANVSKLVDQRLGMEREVLGQRKLTGKARILNAQLSRSYSADYTADKELKLSLDITAPASPEAIALDGAYSSFQPKPAVECILVCQRPFTTKHKRSDVYRILGGKYDYWYTARTEVKEPKEGRQGNIDKLTKQWATELAQAGYTLKDGDVIERRLALRPDLQDEVIVNREVVLWSAPYKDSNITSSITHALDSGKGVMWLEDVRIPYQSDVDYESAKGGDTGSVNCNIFSANGKRQSEKITPQGRFPANILVGSLIDIDIDALVALQEVVKNEDT